MVDQAIALRDQGEINPALALLQQELNRLAQRPSSPLVEDARRLLQRALDSIGDGESYTPIRKILRCTTASYSRMSSHESTRTDPPDIPSFKQARATPASRLTRTIPPMNLGPRFEDALVYATIAQAQERIWHHSQKFRPKSDGSAVMEITVTDRLELLRWILGWGDQARLLEPASLVEELQATLDRMSAQYGQGR